MVWTCSALYVLSPAGHHRRSVRPLLIVRCRMLHRNTQLKDVAASHGRRRDGRLQCRWCDYGNAGMDNAMSVVWLYKASSKLEQACIYTVFCAIVLANVLVRTHSLPAVEMQVSPPCLAVLFWLSVGSHDRLPRCHLHDYVKTCSRSHTDYMCPREIGLSASSRKHH